MSFDFGWLPVGVLVALGLGIIFQARRSLRKSFDQKPPSTFGRYWQHITDWIIRQLPSLGWIVVGAIFGSWAVLIFGPTQSTYLIREGGLSMITTNLMLLGQELDRIQVILIAGALGLICIGVLWYVLRQLRNLRIESPPHHESGSDY